ncbi:MAG: hypothetical protein INR65_14100 [Gluconacetobacter diazotrophicus]|nr:hypothetical protein [Gluconacetobacter diazotrophicus]
MLLRLRDLRERPDAADTLRIGFGATAAEAQVVLRLAAGDTPAEIAERRRVSLATIRTQLRAVLEKTEARSLRDMVRLVNRL